MLIHTWFFLSLIPRFTEILLARTRRDTLKLKEAVSTIVRQNASHSLRGGIRLATSKNALKHHAAAAASLPNPPTSPSMPSSPSSAMTASPSAVDFTEEGERFVGGLLHFTPLKDRFVSVLFFSWSSTQLAWLRQTKKKLPFLSFNTL